MRSAHELVGSFQIHPGPLERELSAAAAGVDLANAALFRRDASFWSADAATQKKISNRLGWLNSPLLIVEELRPLRAFADRVRADGFTDVVLLGMGGSSLAPEVLRRIVGIAPEFPSFHMLDSTDPAAIAAVDT